MGVLHIYIKKKQILIKRKFILYNTPFYIKKRKQQQQQQEELQEQHLNKKEKEKNDGTVYYECIYEYLLVYRRKKNKNYNYRSFIPNLN